MLSIKIWRQLSIQIFQNSLDYFGFSSQSLNTDHQSEFHPNHRVYLFQHKMGLRHCSCSHHEREDDIKHNIPARLSRSPSSPIRHTITCRTYVPSHVSPTCLTSLKQGTVQKSLPTAPLPRHAHAHKNIFPRSAVPPP